MSPTAAPAKSFAGNRPELVKQRPDGAIRLTAAAASIHGPTLVFEPEFGNLGYWHSAGDRASWTFEVDRRTDFSLSIEWACADESAGNPFLIRCGDEHRQKRCRRRRHGELGKLSLALSRRDQTPRRPTPTRISRGGTDSRRADRSRAVVLTPREADEQKKPTATPKP